MLGERIDFSTSTQSINDKNAEYFIQCRKHFGNGLCVMQFNIQNGVED
jgi:hypothetical protein